jgi:hypothetical protein
MLADAQELSSHWTFVTKVVLPPIVTVAALLFAAATFLAPGQSGTADGLLERIAEIGVSAGLAAFAWSLGLPLKRVLMDDAALYVSNYRVHLRVPFVEIAEVTDAGLLQWHLITVTFTSPNEFGASIVFLPELRWGTLLGEPPVVNMIRDAIVRTAGGGNGGVAV